MKKIHKEQLSPKLKLISEKIQDLLKEEGLEEFGLKEFKLFHKSETSFSPCGDNEHPCLIQTTNGMRPGCCRNKPGH